MECSRGYTDEGGGASDLGVRAPASLTCQGPCKVFRGACLALPMKGKS